MLDGAAGVVFTGDATAWMAGVDRRPTRLGSSAELLLNAVGRNGDLFDVNQALMPRGAAVAVAEGPDDTITLLTTRARRAYLFKIAQQ
jgi:hypothetical protein